MLHFISHTKYQIKVNKSDWHEGIIIMVVNVNKIKIHKKYVWKCLNKVILYNEYTVILIHQRTVK